MELLLKLFFQIADGIEDWQLFQRLGSAEVNGGRVSKGGDLIAQLISNLTSRVEDPRLLEKVRREAAHRVMAQGRGDPRPAKLDDEHPRLHSGPGGGPIAVEELGIYDQRTDETTPIIWQGELLVVEGRTTPMYSQEALMANGSSHFRVRKQALRGRGTNEVVVPLIPDSTQMTFCNAHISGETLWVFGTNDDTRWGGAARSQVHAFWSSDPALQRWNHSLALQLPVGYTAFNTDVTTGPDGWSFMAVELGKPAAIVGVPFTTVFAKTRSSHGRCRRAGSGHPKAHAGSG